MKNILRKCILLSILVWGFTTLAFAQDQPPADAPSIQFTLNNVSKLTVTIWGTGSYWVEQAQGKFTKGDLPGSRKDAKPITLTVANPNIALYGKIEGLLCDGDAKQRPIKQLDFKGKAHTLEVLHCQFNVLTTLDLRPLTKLKMLNCTSNKIDTLNLEGLTDLDTLICMDNKLQTLDLRSAANLRYFDMSRCQFAALEFPGLTKLETLICKSNKLKMINLQALTGLKNLYCQDNAELKTLDLSFNRDIERVQCHGVALVSEAWNALYCTLPDRNGGKSKGTLVVAEKESTTLPNTIAESDARIAIDKQWIVVNEVSMEVKTKGEASCKTAYLFTPTTDIQLEAGKTHNLDLTLMPATIGREKIRYKSSDTAIAVVKDGTIKGVANGKATIEVTVLDTRASLKLTVTVTGSTSPAGSGSGNSDSTSNSKGSGGSSTPKQETPVRSVDHQISITPVPFTTHLCVHATDLVSVSLYSLLGDEVAREMHTDGVLHTADLPAGMYVVVLYFADGTVSQRMVLKER